MSGLLAVNAPSTKNDTSFSRLASALLANYVFSNSNATKISSSYANPPFAMNYAFHSFRRAISSLSSVSSMKHSMIWRV
jgi:hypothetical protein